VSGETDALLDVRDVYKQFGAVTALAGVSFGVGRGEIVALLGDNGAGKSTLIKGLSGVYAFDSGEVLLDGESLHLGSPSEARGLGIETVFQDLAIFDNLNPTVNMYIGREISSPSWLRSFGWLRRQEMFDKTKQSLDDLQVGVPSLAMPLGVMSGGQRQAIACARAMTFASKLVILDEPTAALGLREAGRVLDTVRRLPASGAAVILISHNLEDVMSVAHRAVILRQGRTVGNVEVVPENRERIVSLIVSGRDLGSATAEEEIAPPS